LRQRKNKITGELFTWFRNLCSKRQLKAEGNLFLPMLEQVKAWRKASQKMDWQLSAVWNPNSAILSLTLIFFLIYYLVV